MDKATITRSFPSLWLLNHPTEALYVRQLKVGSPEFIWGISEIPLG
jgi:hypothetical protein